MESHNLGAVHAADDFGHCDRDVDRFIRNGEKR
jgi:hypothetical protein